MRPLTGYTLAACAERAEQAQDEQTADDLEREAAEADRAYDQHADREPSTTRSTLTGL